MIHGLSACSDGHHIAEASRKTTATPTFRDNRAMSFESVAMSCQRVDIDQAPVHCQASCPNPNMRRGQSCAGLVSSKPTYASASSAGAFRRPSEANCWLSGQSPQMAGLASSSEPTKLHLSIYATIQNEPVTHVSEQCYPCPRSAHLTGRPSIPETSRFNHCRLWNTGPPAFAGDDTEKMFDSRVRSKWPVLSAGRMITCA